MTSARLSQSPRLLFAILLWVVALFLFSLFVLGTTAPVAAVEWNLFAQLWAQRIGLGSLAITLVGIILWKPALPWIQMKTSNLMLRLNTNMNPVRAALERISQLPTSRDHLLVGKTMVDLGDIQHAAQHLMKAVELEPSSVPAHYAISLAQYQLGNYAAAVDHLHIVIQREADHAYGNGLLMLGLSLDKLGRDKEALAALEQHEKGHGPNPHAFFERAKILTRNGNIADAQSLLAQAAEKIPGRKSSHEDNYWRARAQVARKGGATR